ncbi:MAG: MFS transporter [Ancalomicrobiaceae bacterium]|nr:MFS transporter [Ancalomicrobiaceae bacterium]
MSETGTVIESDASVSALKVALVILALACGGFGIGTGEFAIMGLLPNVAATFRVSVPDAGYVITAYAAGVVIGAPLIAVAGAKASRRTLLLILMVVFAIGNLASAVAPSLSSMIVLRFLTGLPHGAYFGVAALVAASLVPIGRRTQTVGYVMMGLTVATLLGTPVMAVFGEMLSWRVMFFSVGFIGTLTVLLLWLHLPEDEPHENAGVMRELIAFTHPQVLLTLLMAATGFGGMFSIFSYIAATTTDYAHLPVVMVAVIMALFGLGMNVGNLIGSRLADRSLLGTIGGALVFNIVVMIGFGLTAQWPVALCVTSFLLGGTFAVGPAVQSRLMDVARDGQTLAAASMHSAFNIANALGAWLGGRVLDYGFGYPATGYVGALLSAVGLGVFAVSVWLDRRAALR